MRSLARLPCLTQRLILGSFREGPADAWVSCAWTASVRLSVSAWRNSPLNLWTVAALSLG